MFIYTSSSYTGSATQVLATQVQLRQVGHYAIYTATTVGPATGSSATPVGHWVRPKDCQSVGKRIKGALCTTANLGVIRHSFIWLERVLAGWEGCYNGAEKGAKDPKVCSAKRTGYFLSWAQ